MKSTTEPYLVVVRRGDDRGPGRVLARVPAATSNEASGEEEEKPNMTTAEKTEPTAAPLTRPCDQCPWRLKNQGTRHPSGFYTQRNLRRLWNQVRGADRIGCMPQSCHLTDPWHPEHIAAGAKPGATPRECPGSVILVLREVRKIAGPDGVIRDAKPYLAKRNGGLTKAGVAYWCINRIGARGHMLLGGGGPLPEVDVDDAEIGLPEGLVTA